MRRILPESMLEEVGKLDPAAIAQVRQEACPDVRDADELHDVLHTLIAVPADHLGTDAIVRPAEQSSAVVAPELALALPDEGVRDYVVRAWGYVVGAWGYVAAA